MTGLNLRFKKNLQPSKKIDRYHPLYITPLLSGFWTPLGVIYGGGPVPGEAQFRGDTRYTLPNPVGLNPRSCSAHWVEVSCKCVHVRCPTQNRGKSREVINGGSCQGGIEERELTGKSVANGAAPTMLAFACPCFPVLEVL